MTVTAEIIARAIRLQLESDDTPSQGLRTASACLSREYPVDSAEYINAFAEVRRTLLVKHNRATVDGELREMEWVAQAAGGEPEIFDCAESAESHMRWLLYARRDEAGLHFDDGWDLSDWVIDGRFVLMLTNSQTGEGSDEHVGAYWPRLKRAAEPPNNFPGWKPRAKKA